MSQIIQRQETSASTNAVQSSSQSAAGTIIATTAPTVQRFFCERSTPILDRVWHLSRRHRDTCFLVNRTALPDELTQQFTGKGCIVVSAKTQWDVAAAFHSTDALIGYAELALPAAEMNQLKVLLAFDYKTLLIDFEGLRNRVFHIFEAELPIVYKAQDSCALVVHPYHPQHLDSMLSAASVGLTADWDCTGLSFEDEIRRRLRSNLPRNVIVVTDCIDMTRAPESAEFET
ncbi:hypothetical protein [Paraburkholderia sp. RL17-337-BIB-A]|uniref:hypothetical protein n=1 Tax=Paraburkholderia sp. RL17-337-BIB-A TaxID=3031636 RepID=UPI0038B95AC6